MKNKMKTKKSVSKRVRKTASGKLKIGRTNRSHRAQGKTTKQKRHLRKASLMSSTDQSRINKLLQGAK